MQIPQLRSVEKIFGKASHSAFTDLIRYRNRWLCAFRESDGHWGMGKDGKELQGELPGVIRVVGSEDGKTWQSLCCIEKPDIDLRDPHFSINPEGQLMLVMGARFFSGDGKFIRLETFVSFSSDGKEWSESVSVYQTGEWIWRVTWHQGQAYGAAYGFSDPSDRKSPWHVHLVTSQDGLEWTKVVDWELDGQPSETTIRFRDDEMFAIVRRDRGNREALLGKASAPYKEWKWESLGRHLSASDFLFIDHNIWVCGREVDYLIEKPTHVDHLEVRNSLGKITEGGYQPLITLPGGNDTGYPGMVYDQGELWVSFYASHEEKCAIYLAKVEIR